MSINNLILRVIVAMIAFAANSVLCRLALKRGHIDPARFSYIRLISGAVILLPFLLKKGTFTNFNHNVINSFLLMIYAVFFSVAYIHLDTGTGALLMFGVVQLAMIVYGLLRGETFTVLRGARLFLALSGMLLHLLPGSNAPPLSSVVMMAVSGLAWAAYSIRGRTTTAPHRPRPLTSCWLSLSTC
ncbi:MULTISPECIES: hypothetical protein [Providencia]|uniref:hypothetical protein n=1 Tax=Providencia TaxID=586 RepID=UPI002934D635|nr:hypothetical protein [Providencia sp. PROV114]